MKRVTFLMLAASVACAAVAFSPGPEVALALNFFVLIALTVAVVLAVPWLKTALTSLSTFAWTGHGHAHAHLRADGPGAGGRHGLPRSILASLLVFWALILAVVDGLVGRAQSFASADSEPA